MVNPYQPLVSDYALLMREGRGLPLGGITPCAVPPPAADAPLALIFSPHPDDEVIVGGLALRLLREAGWRVVNVAVTLGSNPARRAERLAELRACCDFIGFGLEQITPDGLERVNLQTREQEPAQWSGAVESVAGLLARHRPQVVFFPHAADWNSTHVGTHFLLMDALKRQPDPFKCQVVETEFWGAMTSPNLMVELDKYDLADVVAALSFHVGEMKRNPYHLRLPAWMMDNVRRGGELAGGQGGVPPDFTFATLYRVSRWNAGRLEPAWTGGKFLGKDNNAGEVWR